MSCHGVGATCITIERMQLMVAIIGSKSMCLDKW